MGELPWADRSTLSLLTSLGPQGQSQWEHPALDPSLAGTPSADPSDGQQAAAAASSNPKRRQYAAAQAQAYVNPDAGAALSPSLGAGGAGPELFTPGYTGQDASAPAPYYAPATGQQPAYGQPQQQVGGQQTGQMAQLAGQFGQMGMSGGVDLRVSLDLPSARHRSSLEQG
jgi:hypothetical protein